MRAYLKGMFAVTLSAALGCGGSDAKDPVEDPPDDPQPGPATVTLNSAGEPAEGLTVLFHNPDGSLIDTVETGSNGAATATVPPNAMMSIVMLPPPPPPPKFGFGDATRVYTLFGVQPDDTYVFDVLTLEDIDPPGPNYKNLEITLPGFFEGANDYFYHISCSAQATTNLSTILGLPSHCLDSNGKFAVLVLARDVNAQPLGFTFLADQTPELAPTAFGGVPVANTPVTMPAWQTTFVDAELATTGYPVQGEAAAYLTSYRGTLAFDSRYADGLFRQPSGVFQTQAIEAYGFFNGAFTLSADKVAAPLANTTVNLSQRLVGTVFGAALETDNAARPTFSFGSSADPEDLDVNVGCTTYRNHDGKATIATVVWSFMMPPSQEEFTFPTMPTELAFLAPNADSEWYQQVVTQSQMPDIEGYEEARTDGRFDVTSTIPNVRDMAVGDAFDVIQYHAPLVTALPTLGGGPSYSCGGLPLGFQK